MTAEELSSTVLDAPLDDRAPGQVLLKLESLLTELESDVLYCQTRDQHIRAVTRVAQVVDLIRMFG